MSFDATWEKIYQTRGYNRYPSEEVIGFVMRHFSRIENRAGVNILELGCGQGANLWFLAREGFGSFGIDGSPTALELAREALRRDGLKAHLELGDFSELSRHYKPMQFDAVIDMGSLQSNPIDAISETLSQIHALLKPRGVMFSRMMQAGTYGDGLGTFAGPKAYRDIRDGPLRGYGFVQLVDFEDIRNLFNRFVNVRIEESLRSLENRQRWAKRWVVEATKS